MKLKVSNLVDNDGINAANQFVIEINGVIYFQSSETPIAKIGRNRRITFSKDWINSGHTRKYLYIFMQRYSPLRYIDSKKDVLEAIENGLIDVVEKIIFKL